MSWKVGGLILRDHPAHEVHRKFEMIIIFIPQMSPIPARHYYLAVYKLVGSEELSNVCINEVH